MQNTPFDQFLQSLLNLQNDANLFWLFMKMLFLLAFFLYILFAVVVVRQVYAMTAAFKTTAEFVLKVFAVAHLIFAIVILLAAYLIL
jgi:hypothetical protein